MKLFVFLPFLYLSFFWVAAFAQAQTNLNAALGERVEMIKKSSGILGVDLETTIFQPTGDGPFPVVIINHGKQAGDPIWQARYRPLSAVRFFLARGYLVVVPMRQGFSKSTGSYIGAGCNVHSNGLVQAEDVVAVLDFLKAVSYADTSRTVIAGQSHGGLTTMAFGTLNHPGVKGLINFAGGLRQETCTSWESNLARAFGSYGEKTTQPSIWFYGDNDSYWPTWLYQQMHKNYIAKGANAKLVAFGVSGSDAHSMFGSKDGDLIWQPEVSQFLASIGLPAEVSASGRKYVLADSDIARPIATSFAPLNDETKVPFISVERRGVYKDYLIKSYPKAFAIAPNGSLGWATAGADPMRRALEFCNRRGEGLCRLYSVDDDVVWVAP